MIGEERTLNSKLYSILQTVHKWRTKGVFTFFEGPPVGNGNPLEGTPWESENDRVLLGAGNPLKLNLNPT